MHACFVYLQGWFSSSPCKHDGIGPGGWNLSQHAPGFFHTVPHWSCGTAAYLQYSLQQRLLYLPLSHLQYPLFSGSWYYLISICNPHIAQKPWRNQSSVFSIESPFSTCSFRGAGVFEGGRCSRETMETKDSQPRKLPPQFTSWSLNNRFCVL